MVRRSSGYVLFDNRWVYISRDVIKCPAERALEIAASVACAYYGLFSEAVGNPNTWSKIHPLRLGITGLGDATDARYQHRIGRYFVQSPLAAVERVIREPGIPSETITQRELGSDAPLVFDKIEHTILPVLLVGGSLGEAEKLAGRPEQKRS